MPILDINEEHIVDETLIPKDVPQRPFRTQEELQTSTIFNKDQSLDTIIQYIRGSKWGVNYFLQIKGINEAVALPDPNIPVGTQKYHRINNLDIILQSAITQDNIENITGEAIVNAGFLPNTNDVFMATLTGGREALFYITEVQTRTYNLHQAYYITFKLFCFLDSEPLRYNDLINKVVKEYVYDKEHLLDFSAPVILASDYHTKLNLKNTLPELLEYYLLNFVNYEKNVIALPTKTNIYTDTMLINFLFKIVNYSDHHLIMKLTNFQLDMYKTIPTTIWDALINRDVKMLKRCERDIGFKYTPFTYDNLITKKMNALGIKFIANKLNGEDEALYDVIDKSIEKTMEYHPPVNDTGKKYVVSEDVYNTTGSYTGIVEKMIVDYLIGNAINITELNKAIDQYTMWDTKDQFYLIPILMLLIKDAMSRTYKSL